MEKHVTILAILHIAGAVFFAMLGVFLFLLLAGIGLLSEEREALIATFFLAPIVAGFLIFLSVPGFICGLGLLSYKSWARILGLVIGLLNLFNVPIGTALGAYTLWVLLQDETARLFNKPYQPAPSPPTRVS